MKVSEVQRMDPRVLFCTLPCLFIALPWLAIAAVRLFAAATGDYSPCIIFGIPIAVCAWGLIIANLYIVLPGSAVVVIASLFARSDSPISRSRTTTIVCSFLLVLALSATLLLRHLLALRPGA